MVAEPGVRTRYVKKQLRFQLAGAAELKLARGMVGGFYIVV